jgi:hypothetical protein
MSSAPSTSAAVGSGGLQIVRVGGVAGVRDTVTVQAGSSSQATSKDGRTWTCSPPRHAVQRLRSVDLSALSPPATVAPQLPDRFAYLVRLGEVQVSVSEGDTDDRRASLVGAAAAVVTACVQQRPGPVDN